MLRMFSSAVVITAWVTAGCDTDAGATDARFADASAPGARDAAEGSAPDATLVNSAGLSGSVLFNLVPDEQCRYEPDGNLFFPLGFYDLERRADDAEHSCDVPYVLHLLAEARRKRQTSTPNGTVLELHSARVALMTVEGETLRFEASGELPNPFLVTTNNSLLLPSDGSSVRAVAAVETIPLEYASQLTSFVGEQILVEVQLFGTTLDDEDVALAPFTYPIELCAGCMIICSSELAADSLTPEDVLGTDCPDQAGADGRICIEPDC